MSCCFAGWLLLLAAMQTVWKKQTVAPNELMLLVLMPCAYYKKLRLLHSSPDKSGAWTAGKSSLLCYSCVSYNGHV